MPCLRPYQTKKAFEKMSAMISQGLPDDQVRRVFHLVFPAVHDKIGQRPAHRGKISGYGGDAFFDHLL